MQWNRYTISATTVAALAVLVALFLLLRRKLEARLLFPAGTGAFGVVPNHVQRLRPATYWNRRVKPRVISRPDDSDLRFWFAPPHISADAPATIVVYFHGNCGTAADRLPLVSELRRSHAQLHDAGVALVEYPGYGGDPEPPSEARLLPNALAVLDEVCRQFLGARIVILGRSLGTCIATYAAARRPELVDGLVLVSPFPSIPHVARQNAWVKWVPFEWLMASPFKASVWARDVACPVTIVHGDRDTLVPLALGKEQAQHFGAGKVRALHVLAGGHDSVDRHADFWPSIAAGLIVVKDAR
jgi:pimeloyl-ACP methyl ester carboxylesterase